MPLQLMHLVGFGGSNRRSDAVFMDWATAGTGNFSNTMSFGTPTPNRYLVVAFAVSSNTGSPPSFGVCTIGGQATTNVVSIGRNAGNDTGVAIYVLNAPLTSGTSGNVSATITDAERVGGALYAVYGISPTAHDTVSAAVNDPSGLINVPARGHLIAVSINYNNNNDCTWTGVTEDLDGNMGGGPGISAGLYTATSAVTNRTVQATWGTSDTDAMCAASWGLA